jgi:hypothetical protein
MSIEIEIAAKQLFTWSIEYTHVPELFENNNVRNIAWEICASPIRALFEEALRLDRFSDNFEKDLSDVASKFYGIVNGLIWDDRGVFNDDLHSRFEELIDSICDLN